MTGVAEPVQGVQIASFMAVQMDVIGVIEKTEALVYAHSFAGGRCIKAQSAMQFQVKVHFCQTRINLLLWHARSLLMKV